MDASLVQQKWQTTLVIIIVAIAAGFYLYYFVYVSILVLRKERHESIEIVDQE